MTELRADLEICLGGIRKRQSLRIASFILESVLAATSGRGFIFCHSGNPPQSSKVGYPESRF
jgi:hypothetical protein